MNKLLCYSCDMFEKVMFSLGYFSNENIPDNISIISIGNTYKPYHIFKPSSNVLNLDFDDIDPRDWNDKFDIENATYEDFIYKNKSIAFTQDLAEKSVKFIEDNIKSDFYIHCSAGVSRSQAFVRYIQDIYQKNQWIINENNPPVMPSYHVLCMLKREYLRSNSNCN